MQKEKHPFYVNKEITIAQFMAVAVACVYVSGYLINGLFLRNHGLVQLTVLDSLYLEIGLIFILITGIAVVVPYTTLKWAIKEKRESGLKLNPYTFISPFVSTNYLYVLTFFSIFLTYYEWTHTIQILNIDIALRKIFPIYLGGMFILLASIPIIRRMDFDRNSDTFGKLSATRDNSQTSVFIKYLLIVLRSFAVLLTITFDYLLFLLIPWLDDFLLRAAYFIMWLVIGLVALLIVKKFSSQYNANSHRVFVWLISLPFVLAFYYFTVIAYANGVYKNIPISRGGKLPVTEAIIKLKRDQNVSKGLTDILKSGVFVIEQDSDFLYIIPSNTKGWFKMTQHLYAVQKGDIESVCYSIILDGRPRTE